MPKAPNSLARQRRHNPLADDLVATGLLKASSGKRAKKAPAGDNGDEQGYVDSRASRQILAMSRDLVDEDQKAKAKAAAAAAAVSAPSAFDFDPSRYEPDSDPEHDFANDDEVWGDEEDVVEEIEVDADDLDTFNQFVKPSMDQDPLLTHGWDGKPEGAAEDDDEQDGQPANLADIIMAKIAEREAAMQGGQPRDVRPVDDDYELPPKVVEVYTK